MDFRAAGASFLTLAMVAGCHAPREGPGSRSYVNPALCAGCHPAIARTYRETGMGRSFSRPSPANTFAEGTSDPTYFHPASQSYFTMVRRNGKYFQRRSGERSVHVVIERGRRAARPGGRWKRLKDVDCDAIEPRGGNAIAREDIANELTGIRGIGLRSSWVVKGDGRAVAVQGAAEVSGALQVVGRVETRVPGAASRRKSEPKNP